MNSIWSVMLCLGEPVETPESDPPLDVESLSLLQGTLADLLMLTLVPVLELRETLVSTLSDSRVRGMVT